MTLKLFPILLTCALSTDHFTWMHFKFNMLKANSFFPPITATQCIPPLPEMPLGPPLSSTSLLYVDTDPWPLSQGPVRKPHVLSSLSPTQVFPRIVSKLIFLR